MISNPDFYDNSEFDGESVLGIPSIQFSHHDIDGKFIRDDNTLRILFGRKAKREQIPWQVQIVDHYGDFPKCSGTLVTSNKIVSAAHCFHREKLENTLKPENLVARAGSTKRYGRDSRLQERKCSYIILHS